MNESSASSSPPPPPLTPGSSSATQVAAPAGRVSPSVPTAIEVTNFSFWFKNHKAVDDVSFQVEQGALHGFVGPNGAGKTTTLKAICTLLRPQQGKIRVFGMDVVRDTFAVRRTIGFMPDHFSMYRQMTVYEYLDFFGAAYGLTTKERDRVIGDVLALTDMTGRRDDLISGLSRGMQQRVSLARVLINDPKLLLLDEPASGLDPRARIELMEILRELQRLGKTIFISSHILSELAELCDSVTIIDRGKIKYSGRIDELPTGGIAGRVFTLTLIADRADTEEQLGRLPGVVEAKKAGTGPVYRILLDGEPVDPNSLLRGILELDLPVAEFTELKKHLNQAFMDLTEQGVR